MTEVVDRYTDRPCAHCHGQGDDPQTGALCMSCRGNGTVCRMHADPDCVDCHRPAGWSE